MANDDIAKLRKKVEYNRGLRKIRAEAELVEALVFIDNEEALALAFASAHRARELLYKAVERKIDVRSYESHLAQILQSQAYALQTVKRFIEATELIRESIELFRKNSDNGRELIKNYRLLHLLYRDQDQYELALDALDKALEIGNKIGDRTQDAVIHGARGILLNLKGEFRASVQAFEFGLSIAEKFGDHHGEIVLSGDLGGTYSDFGRPDNAMKYYKRAIAMEKECHAAGNHGLLVNMWNLARLTNLRGDLRKAIKIYDEGVAVACAANFNLLEALTLTAKARLHVSCGEYEAALDDVQRALGLNKTIGNNAGIAMCLALTGGVYHTVGEVIIAREYFAKSCALLDTFDENASDARSELLNTAVTLARYKFDGLDVHRYVRNVSTRISNMRLGDTSIKLLVARQGLGHLLRMCDDNEAARREYLYVLEASHKLEFRFTQASFHSYLGSLLGDCDRNAALVHLKEALCTARDIGARDLAGHTHLAFPALYEDSGQTQQAREHRGQAAEIERETLPQRVILSLRLRHERFENQRLQRESQQLQEQLTESQAANTATQRLLDIKITHINHLRDTLEQLAKSLDVFIGESDAEFRYRAIQIRSSLEAAITGEGWTEFEQETQAQDEDFLLRLNNEFPALTSSERKVCLLIRLNNTTKDLSRLLNISPRSVQAYRYRIRKKLGLSTDVDLNAYILEM